MVKLCNTLLDKANKLIEKEQRKYSKYSTEQKIGFIEGITGASIGSIKDTTGAFNGQYGSTKGDNVSVDRIFQELLSHRLDSYMNSAVHLCMVEGLDEYNVDSFIDSVKLKGTVRDSIRNLRTIQNID